jgi:hypothetical protein
MSATGNGTERGRPAAAPAPVAAGEAGGDPHGYFRAIERAFLRLRGGALLLPPADWQLTRRWHDAGVPLELVLQTLEEVFARRAERGAKDRVSSLRYCAGAVDAAWLERQALQAPGWRGTAAGGSEQGAPGLPPLEAGDAVVARLQALAGRLPDGLPGVEGWRQQILTLRGEPAVVEDQLQALDQALLDTARGSLSEHEQGEVAAEVRRLTAGLRQRLPAAEVGRARERLERQLVRQRLELPLLSLF